MSPVAPARHQAVMRSIHFSTRRDVNQSGVVQMNELDEFLKRLEDLTNRRCWLLYEALRCLPLDRAIDLARSAEAFITGPAVEDRIEKDRVDIEHRAAEAPEAREQLIDAVPSSLPTVEKPLANNRPSLVLTLERREQLLERLAQGARNVELASEFGLASRQVQGIRMGSAREIAKRRDRHSKMDASPQHSSELPAAPGSAEDIVRYLRQQDDVVVPNGDGEFIVNGRFRLGLAELVERANKMRRRQAKPEFQLAGRPSIQARDVTSANGHPMFWEKRSTHSSRAGSGSSV
jgi:hypothetical protein